MQQVLFSVTDWYIILGQWSRLCNFSRVHREPKYAPCPQYKVRFEARGKRFVSNLENSLRHRHKKLEYLLRYVFEVQLKRLTKI